MSRYVVDASVGIKWFLPEIHSAAARRLLDGTHNLVVPDLYFPEIGNILWKRTQRGELTAAEGQETVAALRSLALEVYPSQPLLPAALEIACRTGWTVYDSLYLALADRLDAALVTADERLLNSIAASPLAHRIVWVEDIPSSLGS